MRSWFALEDKVLPPTLAQAMVKVAARRGLDPDRLLRGTGLFEADLGRSNYRLAPSQLLRLAQQCQRQGPADLGFLVGHHLLRGEDELALALRSAPDLRRFFLVLARGRGSWMPLQFLRLEAGGERLYCYLHDSLGLGPAQGFFTQIALGLLAATLRLQLDGRQALSLALAEPVPKALHLYQTHLGLDLAFDSPQTVLSFPRSWWQAPFLEADAAQFAKARASVGAKEPLGLLEWVMRLQLRHLKEPLSLEATAALAGLSPASLKRQLKCQGSSFQHCCDQARKARALHWLCACGASNEVLAQRLGYSDVHNFRRSFKRWTGLVPSVFR